MLKKSPHNFESSGNGCSTKSGFHEASFDKFIFSKIIDQRIAS